MVDFIIAGIGLTPNVELFKNSTLKLNNGIVTDEFCRTSEKDVFAAGDVANFFHPFYNKQMRLESYQHVKIKELQLQKYSWFNLPYTKIPWMWSDQFDLNLQLIGDCNDFDQEFKEVIVSRRNSVFFY